MRNLVIVIAAINVPLYLRQVRSVLLPLRGAEFILAARCSGLGTWTILWRHMLPNSRGQIVSLFALTCGLRDPDHRGPELHRSGDRAPLPGVGVDDQRRCDYIVQGIWWPSVFPGLAIVASVYGLSGVAGQDGVSPVGGPR
jgi:peptide/nickel transport system permease protein